jgi:integrase
LKAIVTETRSRKLVRIKSENLGSILERKINDITSGLQPEYSRLLRAISEDNALTIGNYIQALRVEINLSDHYRRDIIRLLCTLSQYNDNYPFKAMNRDDIISFLESYRKPEVSDPMHRWIGTYNIYRMHLIRLFKWLYYPDLESDSRPKPEMIQNISRLKRKEQSIYKPTDLWTVDDDLLFLKYCPSKRIKCYHAMSRDTGCRPHELLKLRIKEVVFKTTGNRQYAEVLVNGKTGSRSIPLIDSIPYIKEYLVHGHPQSSNPNSILLCGNRKSLGRILNISSLARIYEKYKCRLFPKLLSDPNVSSEDKLKIKELLKKPWNPYVRRHSALTEKSKILKEHTLRQFAGWSANSNMPQKYIHYFGNEASESLLEAYGVVTKDLNLSDALKPKQCPNCSEPNKPDSKFCAKCRMVLTYDAYNETIEKEHNKDSEVKLLKEKYENDMKSMRDELKQEMRSQISQLIIKLKPEIIHQGLS